MPSRPNSAQLAPIKEQVEDEDEKKDVVDGEVENPPASQPKADMSADKVVVRSNNRAQDRSKAYSTAFEHTSPTSQGTSRKPCTVLRNLHPFYHCRSSNHRQGPSDTPKPWCRYLHIISTSYAQKGYTIFSNQF